MLFERLSLTVGIVASVAGNAYAQEITRHKSPGGIEFRHFAMKDAKRTAVAITWKHNVPANGVHISASRLGISLMLNGGAGGKAPDEIIADFEDLDGGSKLFVQPREIRGFIVAPNENMGEAAAIANDVLRQPNLDEKWFDREKKKLVDNAKNRKNHVYGIGWNLARTIMFSDHPYQQFWSLSPEQSVDDTGLQNVKEWHGTNFGTDGIKITVAGSAKPEDVGVSIDKALAGLPTGNNVDLLDFPAPAIPSRTIVFHKPDLPKSLMLIYGAIPSVANGDEISYNLATGVLGYGKQSRLFKAVRSGLRAAYGFRASMTRFTREHSVLTMSGEVETALLQEALDEVGATYREFKTSGVGYVEFPFAKRFYRQRIEKEMKKPSSVAYMMMENWANSRPAEEFDNLQNNIGDVGRSDLNKLITDTYPDFDKMLKIIVTPDANVVKNACVITAIEQWRTCIDG